MASWTNQSTNSLLPGEPWTSAKALAAFENPRAIAEGASGAPTMEVAWHLLEAIQLSSNTDELLFTTDISAYRAIRLVGRAESTSIDNLTFSISVLINGTWRTAVTSATSLTAIIMDVTIDRIDADDLKTTTAIMSERTSAASYATGPASTYMSIIDNTGAATAVRVTANTLMAATDTEVNLYGIKRTAT